eukprot:COSAG04_NODE_27276_length_285_cov_0.311828_1_plen_70_part_01
MASLAFGAAASAVGIGAGTIGVAAPYKQAHDLFRQQINQDRRGALCSHSIEIDLPDMTFDVPPFTPPPFD